MAIDTSIRSTTVLIVGAGPVGLFLACELGAAGVSVVILERDTDPKSIWKIAPLGRRGLQPSSVEVFYRRGMLESIDVPHQLSSGFAMLPSICKFVWGTRHSLFKTWLYFALRGVGERCEEISSCLTIWAQVSHVCKVFFGMIL